MKSMMDDPSIDKDKLQKYYGKNYTDMLKLHQLERRENRRSTGESQSHSKLGLAPLDSFDKKKFKQGKLNYIGVESKIDTNRLMTKEEKRIKSMQARAEHEM